MRKRKPIKIRLIGLDSPANKHRLQQGYNRLFAWAEEEIRAEREQLGKSKPANNSTITYN